MKKLLFIPLLFICSIAFAANQSVTGLDGYLTHGGVVSVQGTNFYSTSTVVYLCDDPLWENASTKVAQAVDYPCAWSGPISVTLDTSGFADRAEAYLMHDDTAITDSSAVGFKVVIGAPNIDRLEYDQGLSYSGNIDGSGFTTNTGDASIDIGDDPVWGSCGTTTSQTINTWAGDEIDFDFVTTGFSNNDTAYLFVTDSYGATSAGFALSIGNPIITSLEGTLIHDASLTITGTSMRIGNGDLLKWDNCDDQGLSTRLTTNGWETTGGENNDPIYNDSNQRHGNSTLNAKCDNYTQYNSTFRLSQDGVGWSQLYVSAWVYGAHNASTGESSNAKMYALRAYDTGNPKVRFDLYPSTNSSGIYIEDITASNSPNRTSSKTEYSDIDADELFLGGGWHRREWYVRASDPSVANGIYKYWRDAELHNYIRGCFISESGGDPYGLLIFNYYYRQDGDPTSEAYFYFDDMYVSTTWAGIELGDAPAYEDCTKREIQIPTTWDSNAEVTIDVNIGGWTSGTQLYLFIRGPEGDVSEGFPVEVGETGEPPEDPDPPSSSGGSVRVTGGRLSAGRIG